jgi:SAM-dependent methyltransferase
LFSSKTCVDAGHSEGFFDDSQCSLTISETLCIIINLTVSHKGELDLMKSARDFDQLGMPAAIAAAMRTGLLAALTEGPATDSELAKRLGLHPRALSLIIDLLHTVELVHRKGDHVESGSRLRALVDLAGSYSFTLGLWAHTEQFLRTGDPFMLMDRRPPEREEVYRHVVGSLATRFEGCARDLAKVLPLHPRTILDVGCGSGVWSLSIAEHHGDARTTGLDLPAVLEHFTARARALGLGDRADTLPGDMHQVTIPRGAFDLAIIANVLRLETPERAASLVERVADGVAPGGSLLIVDAIAEGTHERDRARSLYALHLGLRTRNGQVHRAKTISGWLARAGFSRITDVDIADGDGGIGGLLAAKVQ